MSLNKIKIVFTGSVDAGKTLAINQLSDVAAVSTEVKSSKSSVLRRKLTTTVAMDYGELTLSKTEKLCLYGTPGQRRFDFMSHILCKGALGLIILIDNSQENPLQDLDYYLNLNARFLMNHPAVIGVTHIDESNSPSLQTYQAYLNERGDSFPLIPIDARIKKDVLLLLCTLIDEIEATHYYKEADKLYA
jgi:signal recognition particle receptor subunit beta